MRERCGATVGMSDDWSEPVLCGALHPCPVHPVATDFGDMAAEPVTLRVVPPASDVLPAVRAALSAADAFLTVLDGEPCGWCIKTAPDECEMLDDALRYLALVASVEMVKR